MAVKFTLVPEQMLLAPSEIDTEGVVVGLTFIVTVLDVAIVPVTQVKLVVISTFTTSPLEGA